MFPGCSARTTCQRLWASIHVGAAVAGTPNTRQPRGGCSFVNASSVLTTSFPPPCNRLTHAFLRPSVHLLGNEVCRTSILFSITN